MDLLHWHIVFPQVMRKETIRSLALTAVYRSTASGGVARGCACLSAIRPLLGLQKPIFFTIEQTSEPQLPVGTDATFAVCNCYYTINAGINNNRIGRWRMPFGMIPELGWYLAVFTYQVSHTDLFDVIIQGAEHHSSGWNSTPPRHRVLLPG